jgi:hypothetical protein
MLQDTEGSRKAPTIGQISTAASAGSEFPIHAVPLNLPQQSTMNQFALFVTLYNLALSTHLVALTLNDQAASMKQAARLWELVYSFQWRPSLNLRPLHALAILVNLGHAQGVVGNDAASKKCFENILSAIQILEGRNQAVPSKAVTLSVQHQLLDE